MRQLRIFGGGWVATRPLWTRTRGWGMCRATCAEGKKTLCLVSLSKQTSKPARTAQSGLVINTEAAVAAAAAAAAAVVLRLKIFPVRVASPVVFCSQHRRSRASNGALREQIVCELLNSGECNDTLGTDSSIASIRTKHSSFCLGIYTFCLIRFWSSVNKNVKYLFSPPPVCIGNTY